MDFSKVSRGEIISVVGALLLAVGIFLPFYETRGNGRIDGDPGTFSAFEAHPILRWLLLAAALAPIVLAYIIARDHALSWPRGEMTAVISVAAFGLLFYNGIVDKPGDPSSLISKQFGFWIALVGTILMFYGAAQRSSATERRRKPPGTI